SPLDLDRLVCGIVPEPAAPPIAKQRTSRPSGACVADVDRRYPGHPLEPADGGRVTRHAGRERPDLAHLPGVHSRICGGCPRPGCLWVGGVPVIELFRAWRW